MILDFQTSLAAPKARAIIWKEHWEELGSLPKVFFTNKELCISGLVYLYDQTPYIQISSKNQIKVLSPITTDEARFFVGDTVTLSGVVENVSFLTQEKELINLQLRTPYAKATVNILVKNNNFPGSEDAKNFYLHKPLLIKGKLAMQDKQLQMVVSVRDSIGLVGKQLSNVRAGKQSMN